MKKKRIIIIAVLILIAVLLIVLIPNNNLNCSVDEDCSFFYTKLDENPCFPCSVAREDVICMNKEKAGQEAQIIIEKFYPEGVPPCAPCPPTDDDYECKCANDKCIKQLK